MENLYTEEEAAAFLKIEVAALAKLRRARRIEVIQVTPRRYLYAEARLREYLEARTLTALHSPADGAVEGQTRTQGSDQLREPTFRMPTPRKRI